MAICLSINVWETWTLVSWSKWQQFLRIGNLIFEFQILEDKRLLSYWKELKLDLVPRFGRSEALVVEPVCEGGQRGFKRVACLKLEVIEGEKVKAKMRGRLKVR